MNIFKNFLLTSIFLFAFACVPKGKLTSLQSEYESQISKLEEQNEALENYNESLRGRNEILQNAQVSNVDSLIELSNELRKVETELSSIENELNTLESQINEAMVDFNQEDFSVYKKNNRLYLSLSEDLLFASGSYIPKEYEGDILQKLSNVMNDNATIAIMVEGHTDNVPVANNFIRNNWDLSVLRSATIVDILVERYDVNPIRLTAAGRGEFYKVTHNETIESRKQNRRVEFVFTPAMTIIYDMIAKM